MPQSRAFVKKENNEYNALHMHIGTHMFEVPIPNLA
jgi:hypothetical protein